MRAFIAESVGSLANGICNKTLIMVGPRPRGILIIDDLGAGVVVTVVEGGLISGGIIDVILVWLSAREALNGGLLWATV